MDLEDINKLIQNTSYALDELAKNVDQAPLIDRELQMQRINQAMHHISEIQQDIYKIDPVLFFVANGYDIDARYVQSFRNYLRIAKKYEGEGKIKMARTELRKAIETELPSQMHEMISQELERLSNK